MTGLQHQNQNPETRGGLAINSLWWFPHGPSLFLPLEGLFVPFLVYLGPVVSEKGPVWLTFHTQIDFPVRPCQKLLQCIFGGYHFILSPVYKYIKYYTLNLLNQLKRTVYTRRYFHKYTEFSVNNASAPTFKLSQMFI